MTEKQIKTLDAGRAMSASRFIDRIKKSKNAGEIRMEIEALPARIRINGLLQTFIFLLAKDEKTSDRAELGKALVDYLSGEKVKNYPAMTLQICTNRLRQATEEAFAFAGWLKLMAKAEIGKPEKTGKEKP